MYNRLNLIGIGILLPIVIILSFFEIIIMSVLYFVVIGKSYIKAQTPRLLVLADRLFCKAEDIIDNEKRAQHYGG